MDQRENQDQWVYQGPQETTELWDTLVCPDLKETQESLEHREVKEALDSLAVLATQVI